MPLQKQLLFILLGVTLALPAFAQSGNTPKSLGSFGAWRAFTYNEKKQPICYMVRLITYAKSKNFKRGQSYITITHRPADSSKDVFSFTSGYNFKPTSEVKITVDDKKFNLFTEQETAWLRSSMADHTITTAFRVGNKAIVNGVPATKVKGLTSISDSFDLKGTAAAYNAISKACGYEVEPIAKPAPKAVIKPAVKSTKKTAPKAVIKQSPKNRPRN